MGATLKTGTYQAASSRLDTPSVLTSSGFANIDAKVRPARASRVPTDFLVYLTLVMLTWGAWRVTQLELFTAGDDVGYWIGVVGGVMMLLLFSYPLRKRFRFAQNWGKAKWWFLAHMLLGVGGPVLILVHSTFQLRSLNAAAAFYSMVIVALSGVIGRFFYSRVNRGLHGEQSDLQALREKSGLDQKEAYSRLQFAPEVERRLVAFGQNEVSARPGFVACVRRVFWLPVRQWWTYRQCVRELQAPLALLAKQGGWDGENHEKRQRQARKLVRRYLNAVVRVAQFTAYERLFSLWHVAHIPFVYLLVLSSIVHVVAVHAY
ncbi:SLC45 family MFS transporter [Hydrogenophaga sp. PAMC20947]|uniref:SLC45 family MFS transporter n=1 Tax=Hydrogenophaga sp. PAMC20947 TaxID=2565558 RepID=UPI00109DB516|nr:SLC45 family MFS transporter [Hydrogenophaga sp. PAMC20947]QCB45708.1 hypothetical protein E5678_06540 [Hydrogenophaga sp. PAMC20947]